MRPFFRLWPALTCGAGVAGVSELGQQAAGYRLDRDAHFGITPPKFRKSISSSTS
jgi:hypothetical protein